MLEIEKIVKNFRNVQALKGISLSFDKNKITGLIGYNGSGKTTTFNIICNFIEKYHGQVLFDNKKPSIQNYWEIGFLSGDAEKDNSERVINQLLYFAYLYGFAKKEALEKIHELEKVFHFDFQLKKTIKSLSKGNRQKVKLAQTFLNPFAKYFLLDEPFDGLDPIMVKKISNYIVSRKKNATIIITSHRMDVVDAICDEFFVLKEGKLVAQKNSIKQETQVFVNVNRDLDVANLKADYIKEVIRNEKENQIVLYKIADFIKLTEMLLKQKDYLYHSLKEKSLSENVFEQYDKDIESNASKKYS